MRRDNTDDTDDAGGTDRTGAKGSGGTGRRAADRTERLTPDLPPPVDAPEGLEEREAHEPAEERRGGRRFDGAGPTQGSDDRTDTPTDEPPD